MSRRKAVTLFPTGNNLNFGYIIKIQYMCYIYI